LGVADQLAGLVVDRREDHVGPEARAVLANPPAFLFEPAQAAGDLQLAVAAPGGDVLRQPEHRRMAADDLTRQVAVDAFGGRVPGGDPPLAIEHEDGVVLDRINEQAEPLFATPQVFLGAAAQGQVARHLREAQQRAVLRAQGRDDHVGPKARAVLADPPALVLDPAVPDGQAQQVVGLAALTILGRIEDVDPLADHLAALIALDELGAPVPGLDVTGGAEHEDRVILDRVDDHTEALVGAGAPQAFVLQPPAFRQVARHLGVPDQVPGLVPQRGEDHVGPEPGPVLADAPAFVLHVPFGTRLGQQDGGQAAGTILGRVEDLDVLSDDLVALVALDQLRADVPGLDVAISIQQTDRVIANTVDENAKAIPADAQHLDHALGRMARRGGLGGAGRSTRKFHGTRHDGVPASKFLFFSGGVHTQGPG